MNTIRFSKDYKKLPKDSNGKTARLIFVRTVRLEKQTAHFLEYDTVARDGSHYPLPEIGDYLLLVFLLDGAIFTTLRSYSKEKAMYYLHALHEDTPFEVVVEASK